MKFSILSLALVLLVGAQVASADMESSYQELQKAVAAKDAAQVKKLAAETSEIAHQVIASPAPSDPDMKKSWENHIGYAKQIDVYTEYALYATAAQAKPATAVDLLAALIAQNPKSKYLDTAYGRYFVALHETGADAKIVPAAQKAIASLPNNLDALQVLAEHALNAKQVDAAANYAQRMINALKSSSKPEDMSAADWARRKDSMLGRGSWVAGVAYAQKNDFFKADENLRVALPLVQGDQNMKAAALFFLGLSNYQLGRTAFNRARVLQAANFSEQAAAIPGPYAAQAYKNARAMRAEASQMR